MAATTSGALKSLIEGAGLSLAAYRDDPPDNAALPFVVLHEGISVVPDPNNARWDAAGTKQQAREQVQVDLWQQWKAEGTGTNAESYTLPDALEEALDGAQLSAAPTHVWGVRFLSSIRIPDRTQNRVRHAMTVEVIRDI